MLSTIRVDVNVVVVDGHNGIFRPQIDEKQTIVCRFKIWSTYLKSEWAILKLFSHSFTPKDRGKPSADGSQPASGSTEWRNDRCTGSIAKKFSFF